MSAISVAFVSGILILGCTWVINGLINKNKLAQTRINDLCRQRDDLETIRDKYLEDSVFITTFLVRHNDKIQEWVNEQLSREAQHVDAISKELIALQRGGLGKFFNPVNEDDPDRLMVHFNDHYGKLKVRLEAAKGIFWEHHAVIEGPGKRLFELKTLQPRSYKSYLPKEAVPPGSNEAMSAQGI